MVYDPERGCTRGPKRHWEPLDVLIKEGIVSVNRTDAPPEPVMNKLHQLGAIVVSCKRVASMIEATVSGSSGVEPAPSKEPVTIRQLLDMVGEDAAATLTTLETIQREILGPPLAVDPDSGVRGISGPEQHWARDLRVSGDYAVRTGTY